MRRVWVLVALILGARPGHGEEITAARLHATFARLPTFDPPADDLKIFDHAPLDSDSRITQFFLGEIRRKLGVVKTRRQLVNRAARAYLMAGVSYLRADAGWFDYGKKRAEANMAQREIAWAAALWRLVNAEQNYRKECETYYLNIYSRRFAAIEEAGERARVLKYFADRSTRLRKLRRLTFEVLEDQRDRAFAHLASRALKEYRGRLGADEKANLLLGSAALLRDYAWLVPENTLACTIHAQLLRREEARVRNRKLHPAVVAAFVRDPNLRPFQELPATADGVRLEIVKLRARRAHSILLRDEIALEGSYRNKVSMLLGLRNAFADAGRRFGATYETLVDVEGASAKGAVHAGLATVTTLYKLFGDSLGVAATQIEDFFTDFAMKPLFSLFGDEAKNSSERAREEFLEHFQRIRRRIGLMRNVAGSYGIGQCRQFIDYFLKDHAADGTSGAPVPQNLRLTVRELVKDEAFIAATQGGLPVIFAPLCRDPRRFAALQLRAAQYELGAAVKEAGLRIATARGLKVDPRTFKLDRKALARIYLPKDPQTGEPRPFSQADQMIYSVPFLGSAKGLWDARRNLARTFQLASGLVPDQDKHLERLVDLRDAMRVYMLAFADARFDSLKVASGAWQTYLQWPRLLRYAHPCIEAYRRISTDQAERRKAWYWASHLDATNKLTDEGQALLASLQRAQDMELTSLAVHAAYRKLNHLALSLQYMAASQQVAAVADLERQRRISWSITPALVDLKQVEKGFRAQAHLEEVHQIFQELSLAIGREMVISLASSGIANVVMSRMGSAATRVAAGAAEAPWKAAGKRLWSSLNPWAGKFSASGAYKFMSSKAIDSFKVNIARTVAKKQTMFTAREIESGIDLVLELTEDLRGEAVDEIQRRAAGWVADRGEARRRAAEISSTRSWIDQYAANTLRPLARRIKALGDSEEDKAKRTELEAELREARFNENFMMQRARLKAAMGDYEGAELRRRAALRKAGRAADLLAANMAYVHALERQRSQDFDDEATVAAWAEQFATSDYRRRMAEGTITYPELMRLTNEGDPLGLSGRLLQRGLDVATLRRALSDARNNDPDNAGNLHTLSMALDKLRRNKMAELAREFAEQQDGVARIERDGPGADDPESGNFFDDLGLRIQLAPGAKRKQVEEAFRKFCGEKGFPLGEEGSLIARFETVPHHRRGEDRPRTWPPDRAPRYGYNQGIPKDGELARRLEPELAERIQADQGFRADHARKMHAFAQEHRTFLVVRNGNPDSVRYFGRDDVVPKPMSSKAKTQKVGPDKGLVVDPTHAVQAKEWDQAISAATGERKAVLVAARRKALDTWSDYGRQMLASGQFRIDDRGRVELKLGPRQWKKIHGDYDMHGAFRLRADGSVARVDFGGGQPIHNRLRRRFIRQLNEYMDDSLEKQFVQHGGQDDWIHSQKTADPPVTVFFPDGRPPLEVKTAGELRRFYETQLRVRWEFNDDRAPPVDPPAAMRRKQITLFEGSEYRTSAGADWISNFVRARNGTLAGTPEREVRALDRNDAPGLAMDLARRLGFLNDPRFHPDVVNSLETLPDKLARLDDLVTESEKFLRLADALVLAQPSGAELYKQRIARGGGGYFTGLLNDIKALGAFPEGDLADLRTIVNLQRRRDNPDPWGVVGGRNPDGVRTMLRLREFMRRKSADMLAGVGVVLAEQRRSLTRMTPGETAAARGSLRQVADVAVQSQARGEIGVTGMLVPPVTAGPGRAAVPPDIHRRAIWRAMETAMAERLAVAGEIRKVRAQIRKDYAGKELDDPAREEIERRLAEALRGARGGGDTEAAAGRWRWIDSLRELAGKEDGE